MFWRWLVRIWKCLWMIKVKNSVSCKTFTQWNRRKTKKLLQMKSKRQQKMYLFQRLRTYFLCRVRYRVFVEKNTQTKLLQVVSATCLIIMYFPDLVKSEKGGRNRLLWIAFLVTQVFWFWRLSYCEKIEKERDSRYSSFTPYVENTRLTSYF